MSGAITLDAIDRRILQALQSDGRMTYDELARQAGLSASAALRRVRRLEEIGVIVAYAARIDAAKLGLSLTAYISVRLEKHGAQHRRSPLEAFVGAMQAWPEVLECSALTGEMDILLLVVVEDMAHYSRFIVDTLLKHPNVQDCKTSFVLQRLKGGVGGATLPL
jgi:Lrp/AsnC family transcriptional regulator, leucine-responsive regulatory protein